jgi:hypothetical protein
MNHLAAFVLRLAAASVWHGETAPRVWQACPEYFLRRQLDDGLRVAANDYDAEGASR